MRATGIHYECLQIGSSIVSSCWIQQVVWQTTMALTIEKRFVFTFQGRSWLVPATDISPDEDWVSIRWLPALGKLVFDDSKAKLSLPIGWKSFIDLRSDACNENTAPPVNQEVRNLFDEEPSPKKRRGSRHRVSRAEMFNIRTEGEAVTITIPTHTEGTLVHPATDIKVMRSAHPTDKMQIELKDSSLGAVFSYMRASGFEDAVDADAKPQGTVKMGAGRYAIKSEGLANGKALVICMLVI